MRRPTKRRLGKWRGQGKWRDPRSFRRAKSRSAVDRNAADRSGTMAPAAERVRVREDMPGGLLFVG